MGAIVGREHELSRTGAVLELRPNASRVLVLEGDPGMGKTTLWRSGLDLARGRGFRVLAFSATRAESQLSFGALRDILQEAFDEAADELPAPQRRALEITLLRREAEGAAPEQGAVATAFLGVLRALAARRPLVVAVDDAQWLDRASLLPFAYALRRFGDEPVAALIAHRPGEIDELAPAEAERLTLDALSVGALARILHERTGTAFPRATVQRLHQASGGNPLHGLELARALLASQHDPVRSLRPSAVLPVPDDLRVLVRTRLLALPPGTVEALSLASALARPTLPLLGQAIGGDAERQLRPAAQAGVVEVEGDAVRFSHPLYASAVYELLGSGRRAELHERLAKLVDEPEERSHHLALGTVEPDEEVAAAIEAAARAALGRGAPGAAADLAFEALRVTPPGRASDRLRRAVLEADGRFAAGDAAAAHALLEGLAAAAPEGTKRAALLSRQARVRHFATDMDGSIALLRRALDEAEPGSPLRAEIEEGLAWGLLLARRDLEQGAAHARSAAANAEARSDEAALAESLAVGAVLELVLGRPWEDAMRQALAHEPATRELRVLRQPSFAYGYCLSCVDDLEQAREVFEELERRASEAGDIGSLPPILNHLTLVEVLAGRWETALAHADAGFAAALEGGQEPTQASILAKRALLEGRRGRVDDARATATAALEIAGFDAASTHHALARGGETAIWALGAAELASGDAARAAELLAPMCDALLAAGIEEPGELRALPHLVEALAVSGRHEEAKRYVLRLEASAARLQRPSATGAALRARALLLDGEDAIGALTGAAAAYEHTALPFEHARTLLELGTHLRRGRRRRAARETLGRARAVFAELGSELWTKHADAELARVGGRSPGDPSALTPTEHQVAVLVAQGRTNREVASELVVSVHTVEAALTSIYRKLNVRSRTELARSANL